MSIGVWVPLSAGRAALVDREDASRVMRFKWSLHRNGSGQEYAVSRKGGRTRYLHRFIVGVADGEQVDHENRDGLDCRRENLRPATPSQNSQNRRNRKNVTGFRGVVPQPSGRWQARLKIRGRSIHVGTFDTPERAALARDAAVLERFGRFAVLNFPAKKLPQVATESPLRLVA